jgi:glutathione S-transferase
LGYVDPESILTHAVRKLVSLHVSPWSERAKWALDHHGLAYQRVEHVPIVGERRLRQLVGPDKPRATVPVLVDGDEVLSESWDIAVYADRLGKGSKLIPAEHEAAIRAWTACADGAMQAGRPLVMTAMLASPAALDEASPPFIPRPLRPLFRPIARRVTKAFVAKYDVQLGDEAGQIRAMRDGLTELRKGLGSGKAFLLGSFTYADIAMATLIQGVLPVNDRFIRLGPATRSAWTRTELANDFADLVAWRDELYANRRKR